METTTLQNPFVVGRYVSDHYFCDRETETQFLIKQIENRRNTALISPRRMGKTGLIQHTFNREAIKDKYYTFFVDIYATSSLAEFVYLLGKTIYDELKPQKTVWAEKFFQMVSSFRIGAKMDPMTGETGLDIGLGDIQMPTTTLDEIFDYLEKADRPCVVAIDEFQQIGEFQENNVEALLRTKIQQCKQTVFIFAGSKRHLMYNMFNSSSKPFYQSSINMTLAPIPMDIYVGFARRLFNERGKDVESGLIEQVYKRFEGCTWFMQVMMNELFAITNYDECAREEQMNAAWQNIVMMQEGGYKEMLLRLSPKQKMLLQAIAREGRAVAVTSADFVQKYRLPSASSVQAALKGLTKNDIVIQEESGYRVYDYFFAEWLRRCY